MNARAVQRAVKVVADLLAPQLPAELARLLLPQPGRKGWRWSGTEDAAARRVTFRFGLTGLHWGTQGPVTLMVHGPGGQPSQFRYLVDALVRSGRQVVALEGPGASGPLDRAASVTEFAMAILEAAVELPALDSIIGHSLGGAAVMVALANGLRVERAVVIATPALPAPGEADAGRSFATANDVPNLARVASQLTVPALIVHDWNDRAAPFAAGEGLAKAWRGARLLATSGLGHWRILADASVAQGIGEFVAGHGAGLTERQLRALERLH